MELSVRIVFISCLLVCLKAFAAADTDTQEKKLLGELDYLENISLNLDKEIAKQDQTMMMVVDRMKSGKHIQKEKKNDKLGIKLVRSRK